MAILLPMGMVGSEKTKLNRISGGSYRDTPQFKEYLKFLEEKAIFQLTIFLEEVGFHTVDKDDMNKKIEDEINRQEKIENEEKETNKQKNSTIEKDKFQKYRKYLMNGKCVSGTYESMARNLIKCWKKYNMYRDEQMFYFLAQCLAEVGGDDDLIENGNGELDKSSNIDEYYITQKYVENGVAYCGAGYIQLTSGANYIDFTLKRLKEELPFDYSKPNSAEGRKSIIEEWKENAKDVAGYTEKKFYEITAIYLIGPPIVAKEYPWEVSCYFWQNTKIIYTGLCLHF